MTTVTAIKESVDSGANTIGNSITQAASGVSEAAAKINDNYGDILKHYLIAAMEKTGNLVDKSVDMVMEQAPILVHEVLNWYFAYNLILCVAGILIMAIVAGVWTQQIRWGVRQSKLKTEEQSKWYKQKSYDVTLADFRIGTLILMVIPFIIGMTMVNVEWLKIWIAPRLWLIEYTAELIKQTTK